MIKKLSFVIVLAVVGVVFAQRRFRGGDPNDATIYDRRGVPNWEVDRDFKKDVFTFVRVRYSSYGRSAWKWRTDFPDSDLNFSFRLQQLTSLKVNPDGKVLDLTDEKLFDYPFLYMIEPGEPYFEEEEVAALRALSWQAVEDYIKGVLSILG